MLRNVLARISLPVIPKAVAVLFTLNYVASRAMSTISSSATEGAAETKETVSAFLFACVAAGQALGLSKKSNAGFDLAQSVS